MKSRCTVAEYLFGFDNVVVVVVVVAVVVVVVVVASLLHCFTGRERGEDCGSFFGSVSGKINCYRCRKGRESNKSLISKGVLS